MKKYLVPTISGALLLSMLLSACETPEGQGAGFGAFAGAATGALIGAAATGTGQGAAIGAASGAAAGAFLVRRWQRIRLNTIIHPRGISGRDVDRNTGIRI